jgi:LmbE family N-acetylglucosaminyl deacetylase
MTELRDARRILCVQPHYDDNDLGAGGTIAALAAAGTQVVYLTVTDDLVGVLDASLSDAEARKVLRAEQEEAGAAIGVAEQVWLDFPDAGDWDYFELRRELIRHIRRVRPEFLLTVDPWLPNEMHQDHLRVGRAVAEASFLQSMKRMAVDREVDADYESYSIDGVAFYFTRDPSVCFDIGESRAQKHRAIDAYRAQFTEDQLRLLHLGLEAKEREWAAAEPFEYGEPLKIFAPGAFHVGI